jgi:DNA-directed RNA polymerase specialized sigma24 family protein
LQGEIAPINLAVLRELLRNLQAFRSLYESEGTDTLIAPDGTEWSLWDIQYLYECRVHLSPRQRQAIELCLYRNIKEREAARMMGVSETSPVAVYANNGLKRIIVMIESGQLRKFHTPTPALAQAV